MREIRANGIDSAISHGVTTRRTILTHLLCSIFLMTPGCGGGGSVPQPSPKPPAPPRTPSTDHDIQNQIQTNQKREEQEQNRMRSEQGQSMTPAEALNAPGMEGRDIPIHRDLAFSFEEEPKSPEDLATRLKILNALWNTPLGQTFYAFVFDQIPAEQVPTRSFQFIKRVFANGEFLYIRQATLQALTQDLYVRHALTADAAQRILLLQGDLLREAKQSSSKVKDWFVNQSVAFLIASIPFGSPALREETTILIDRWRRAVDRYFGRKEGERELSTQNFRRLLTREVLYRYQPTQFLGFFFSTFGTYSMVYFFFYDQLNETIGRHAKDKVMLFELDDLVRALQI